MNRRDFIRQAAGTALSGATAAASAAAGRVHDRARTLSRDGGRALGRRLDSIEARFDRLEQHQKNLVRAGALAFTVSTGIDVFTLL